MRLSHIALAVGLALSIAAVAPAQSTTSRGQRQPPTRDTPTSHASTGKRDPNTTRKPTTENTPVPDPTPIPEAVVVPKAGPPSGGLGAVVNPNPVVGGAMMLLALGTLAGLLFRRRRTAA